MTIKFCVEQYLNNKNDKNFATLYKKVRPSLRKNIKKFHKKYNIPLDNVEDIISECYVKLYEKIDLFSRHGDFNGWFYVLCKNVFIDFIRKNYIKHSKFQKEVKNVNFASFNTKPCKSWESIEKTIHDYINLMPDEIGIVIYEYKFESCKSIDISNKYSINHSTVRNRIYKCNEFLKKVLDEEEFNYYERF